MTEQENKLQWLRDAEAAQKKTLQDTQRQIVSLEAELRLAHDRLVVANIDALLALTPEHDRTSCSDANPSNAGKARCRRCALLRTRSQGTVDANLLVTVHVTTRPDTEKCLECCGDGIGTHGGNCYRCKGEGRVPAGSQAYNQ